jgi:hypothetical protein
MLRFRAHDFPPSITRNRRAGLSQYCDGYEWEIVDQSQKCDITNGGALDGPLLRVEQRNR